MPRIPNRFLNKVFYLYKSREDADNGVSEGGTGFFVSLENPPGFPHLYAVTNAHNIEHENLFLRINKSDGGFFVHETGELEWRTPSGGGDIAIYRVGFDVSGLNIHAIPRQKMLTKSMMEENNIGIGDDAFLLGRYIKHSGKSENSPALLFGNIAMFPNEKIRQIGRDNDQESILVDMRTMSGFSGSPVFIYRSDQEFNLNQSITMRPPLLYFLGIDWGAYPGIEKLPSSITCIVPSWNLLEFFESPSVVAEQNEIYEAYLKKLDDNPDSGAMLS